MSAPCLALGVEQHHLPPGLSLCFCPPFLVWIILLWIPLSCWWLLEAQGTRAERSRVVGHTQVALWGSTELWGN